MPFKTRSLVLKGNQPLHKSTFEPSIQICKFDIYFICSPNLPIGAQSYLGVVLIVRVWAERYRRPLGSVDIIQKYGKIGETSIKD
jgi:hypothetical protein